MVTQPSRRAHLRRALSDYAWQTYPWRELVVVCDEQHAGDAGGVRADVAALGRDDVRCVTPSGRLTLGALRNVGWASASGDVTLQWDDDDRYHPDRIAAQAGAWQRAGTLAVCLTEVMHYDPRAETVGVTKRPFQNQGGTFGFGGWSAGPDVIPSRCSKPCWRSHVDADHPRAA